VETVDLDFKSNSHKNLMVDHCEATTHSDLVPLRLI